MRLLSFPALLLTIVTASAGPSVKVLIPELDYPGPGYGDTFTVAVSNSGAVAGSVRDSSGIALMFERLPGGGYTTPVGFPGAIDTYPGGVNTSNLICGAFYEVDGTGHGFFYDQPTATFTQYDVPGRLGTVLSGLNDAGDFCGYTESAAFASRGGALVEFTVPGAEHTYPGAINNLGQVAGTYQLVRTNRFHGFLRDADGTLTYPIDFPHALFTQITGLNDNGLIAGTYTLHDSIGHGFVRQLLGRSITFDVAGDFGVSLGEINNTGLMAGSYYLSSDSVVHSFLARFVP